MPQIMSGALPPQRFEPPHGFLPDIVRTDLADEEFHIPGAIDVILGAGTMARLLCEGLLCSEGGFGAQRTSLGWSLFGAEAELTSAQCVFASIELEDPLERLAQRFWEIEEPAERNNRTEEQEQCEQIFRQSHVYLPRDKVYVVRIPLRAEWREIGSTREAALRIFFQVHRRLERNPELKLKYVDTMNDYLARGHLVRANPPVKGDICCYLPHYCVTKKFRVVFNGSFPSSNGTSLNQMQLVGERLQEDLSSILLRFRGNRFAMRPM